MFLKFEDSCQARPDLYVLEVVKDPKLKVIKEKIADFCHQTVNLPN